MFRLLLKNSHTSATLAYILLKEEATFCTVQPLCDIYLRSSLGDIVVIVPIQLSDYIFKASDYVVYVRHCALILSSLRGHAALLQGGIVGHLAREHLAIDSACLGPSSSVTVHHVGFNIVDGDIGMMNSPMMKLMWSVGYTAVTLVCMLKESHNTYIDSIKVLENKLQVDTTICILVE